MVTHIVEGTYDEHDVRTRTVGTRRRDSATVARFVDAGWRDARAQMAARGRHFFDGPLLRFEGARHVHGLEIELSPSISYREVVGLRARPWPADADWTAERLPNPFSVMTVLETRDRSLALGWRSSGDWRPDYEVSGGFARTGEQPFEAARQRLREDFGVEAGDVASLRMIALYTCDRIFETVALFAARTKHDERGVRDASRYDRMLFVDPGAARLPQRLHPPSRTALRLYRELRATCASA